MQQFAKSQRVESATGQHHAGGDGTVTQPINQKSIRSCGAFHPAYRFRNLSVDRIGVSSSDVGKMKRYHGSLPGNVLNHLPCAGTGFSPDFGDIRELCFGA